MSTEQKNVALDDETLETVNGAGLMDTLGRIGESVKTDFKNGAEIGGRGPAQVIGSAIGAYVGLIKGIKNEIS